MTITQPVISGTTRVVGVCGHGISYTLSPAMHNTAFQTAGLDYVYVTFEVAPGQAEAAVAGIRGLGLAGVNVTKPLKTEMLPFLDDVTEDAKRIGSVNTIINQDGRLTGASTDGTGLFRALQASNIPIKNHRIMILGAGGAARAACAMFHQEGAAQTVIAARNREKAENTASVGQATTVLFDSNAFETELRSADLIVNAVPVDLEINPTWFSSGQNIYDTRYDVEETDLMRRARACGARAINGLDMLLFQGAASFEMWTNHEAPIDAMRQALKDGLKK